MATFIPLFLVTASLPPNKTDPPFDPKKTGDFAVDYGCFDVVRSQRKRESLVLSEHLVISERENDILHLGI